VLRFGYASEPPTLDPLGPGGASAATRDILRPTLPSLFRLDANLKPQPDLVSAWPTKNDFALDPFTVTLALHNANWSDGEPITASDVRFSLEKLRKGPTGYRYRYLRDVEVVDPHRFRLRFDRLFRRWWSLFSIDDMVLPAHAYSADWEGGPSVSGGPYTVAGWTRGLSVHLVRNERYWGRKATLAGIDVTFVPDDETRLQLLDSGELDAFDAEGEVNIGRRAGARGLKTTTRPLDGSGQASGVWGPSWWELDIDRSRLGEGTSKAVATALDTDLAAEIFEDSGRPIDGIPAAFPVAPGRIAGPWSGRGDLNAAAKLKGSTQFQLAFPRGPASDSIASFAHFRLSKIGITAELVGVDDDVFERTWALGKRAPVLLRLRRGADAPDADAYGSSSAQPGSANIDDFVVAAETTVEPERITASAVTGLDAGAWTKAEEGLAQAASAAPLVRVRSWIVGRKGVAGPQATGSAMGPLWNAVTWQITTAPEVH
jgi:hypothetical protein